MPSAAFIVQGNDVTPTDLCHLIQAARYRLSSEAVIQADLEEVLSAAGVQFEREVRLAPAERIDFLVEGRIGIEVKFRAQKREIYRQLDRYAYRERIESLILLSNTAMGLPPTIREKPVYFVSLGISAL